MDRTFVMIKPDGVRKELTGEIVSRFERRGLEIADLRKVTLTREEAEELYAVHRGRDFFGALVEYVTSGPVVLMVVSGPDVVTVVRTMLGATDPKAAAPGTIRGDFAVDISENIVHGSDSPESAAREISIFFS